MKVIGLVSGGKDSIFNLIKCVEHGHEIVALANLYPPSGTDEVDSHMFQTVGHQLVEAIGECMELPLYRAQLKNTSCVTEMNYTHQSQDANQDEIEDLFNLLQEIKAKHPEVQAVSSGAIMSNYQRIRVENVCSRLGLTSLSYLWRRNQRELFTEMLQSGLEAILVKVAVVGLDASHLNKTLTRLYPVLTSIADKYGASICGEGGEYETMVLDCPLFPRKRIVIDQSTAVGNITAPAAIAPVCHLVPTAFRIVDKSPEQIAAVKISAIPMPSPVMQDALQLHTAQLNPHSTPSSSWASETDIKSAASTGAHDFTKTLVESTQIDPDAVAANSSLLRLVAVATVLELKSAALQVDPARDSRLASSALKALFRAYARRMSALFRLDPQDAEQAKALETEAGESLVYVNLVIPSMDSFLAVNKTYQELVPLRAAPARACVASHRMSVAGVSESILLTNDASITETHDECVPISVTVEGIFVPPQAKISKSRMHVQSISAWAPASIGPYAQAYEVAGLILPAGQIGLVPARLALPSTFPALETRQAFLNVHATLTATESRMRRDVLHMTVYVADDMFPTKLQQCGKLLNLNALFTDLADGYENLEERANLLFQLIQANPEGYQSVTTAHVLLLFSSLLRELLTHPHRKPLALMTAEERVEFKARMAKKALKSKRSDSEDDDSWGYDSLLTQAQSEEQESATPKASEPLAPSEALTKISQLEVQEAQQDLFKALNRASAADLVDPDWEDDTGATFGLGGRLSLVPSVRQRSNYEDDSGSEDDADAEAASSMDKVPEPVTPVLVRVPSHSPAAQDKDAPSETKSASPLSAAVALHTLSRFAPVTFISVPTLPRQALVEIQVLACANKLCRPLAARKVVGMYRLQDALDGDVIVCEALVRAGATFYTLNYLTKSRTSDDSKIDVQALANCFYNLAAEVESLALDSVTGLKAAGMGSNELVNRVVVSHPSLLAQEAGLRAALLSDTSFGAASLRLDAHGIVIVGSPSTALIQAAEAERVALTLHAITTAEKALTPQPAYVMQHAPQATTIAEVDLYDPAKPTSVSIRNGWVCAATMSRAVVDPLTWAHLNEQATGW